MKRDDEPCCGPDSDGQRRACCGSSRRSFLQAGRRDRRAGAGRWRGAGAAAAEPAAPQRRAQPAAERAAARAVNAARPSRCRGRSRGAQLAQVAFPLGGIGTGTISLGGRGELRDWEIFNRPERGFAPMYGFAALRARPDGGEAIARVLETKHLPPYEGQSGLNWPTAPGMPRFDSCVFHGEYPFARVDFTDPQVPVEVSLEAWNPLVPLDAESSGLPVAILSYRLRNPGPRAVEVSIAWSVDNPDHRVGQRSAVPGLGGRGRRPDQRGPHRRRRERSADDQSGAAGGSRAPGLVRGRGPRLRA